jgi:hypothetical protein
MACASNQTKAAKSTALPGFHVAAQACVVYKGAVGQAVYAMGGSDAAFVCCSRNGAVVRALGAAVLSVTQRL